MGASFIQLDEDSTFSEIDPINSRRAAKAESRTANLVPVESTSVDPKVNIGALTKTICVHYGGPMSMATVRRWLPDVALSAALMVASLAEIWVPLASAVGAGSKPVSTIAAVLVCAMLAVRRRFPLLTAVAVLLIWPAAFLIASVYVLFWGQLVPMSVALFTAARHGSAKDGYLAGALGAIALLFFDLTATEMSHVSEIVFHWLALLLAWLAGWVLRIKHAQADNSRQQLIAAELASQTQTIAALAEERARIARELHDVVAHAVSMMVVQAGAAGQAVDDNPDYVRAALDTIRTTGSGALAEMRRAVTVLRDGDHNMSLAPQPGLGALPSLIEENLSADRDIALSVTGCPRTLAVGVDLAAYRIIQESLTNVRRHSSASHARVSVDYRRDAVHIRVSDNGTHMSGSVQAEGHGLVGMRERTALYGGRFEARHTASGFIVTASLLTETP